MCSQKFASSTNLRRHYDHEHPEDAPYKCKVCSTNFMCETSLSQHECEEHIPKPSGEKPVGNEELVKGVQSTGGQNVHNPTLMEADAADTQKKSHLNSLQTTPQLNQIKIGANWNKSVTAMDGCREVGISGSEPDQSRQVLGEKVERNVVKSVASETEIHTGQWKPHQCQICSKGFTFLSNLKRHMLSHSGMKPYQCNVCSKGFTRKHDLQRHMHIHSEEKSHQCHMCPKKFARNDHLRNHHVRKHQGDAPYKCEVCSKTFMREIDLTKHERKKHSPKPSSEKLDGNEKSVGGVRRTSGGQNEHNLIRMEAQAAGAQRKADLNSHPTTPQLNQIKTNSAEGTTSTQSIDTFPLRAEHSEGMKSWQCEKCLLAFKKEYELKIHTQSIHKSLKPSKK